MVGTSRRRPLGASPGSRAGIMAWTNFRQRFCVLALLVSGFASAQAASGPPAPEGGGKGSVTGLALPRFAALRSDDVNFRAGPGTRYPIEWVYRRRNLPVEIVREFDVWRLVRDEEGTEGWVHQATLTGRRSFIVIGAEHRLRAAPSEGAATVARMAPGVVGRLVHCDANATWCEAQVKGYHGFLKRAAFWGSFPGEAVN